LANRITDYFWWTFRILLAISLGLLLFSCVLRGEWFVSLLLVIAILATVLTSSSQGNNLAAWLLHPATRVGFVFAALLGFVGAFSFSSPQSIYAFDEVRQKLQQLYDEKMREWPVPFEDRYLETRYGKVHVVVSGKEGMPQLLLLHASGISSWSWKYNIKGLSDLYRIYAIDLLGDAGKSEFHSLDKVFHDKQQQADLYAEIMDVLGISKAYLAGASEGGFIASNFALHYPQRVEKLVLIGPMGYSGALGAIFRIMLTALFPIKSFQKSTFIWAFSENPGLQQDFGEWFRLVMSGTTPVKVAPLPFSPEERQHLQVPVLFIFGQRDNLVGDPQAATKLVQDIPDVAVVVLDAGHLVAAEKPEQVNELLREFFGR